MTGSRAILLVICTCLVATLSGLIIFDNLGRASFTGDESIYVAVARQSVKSGEWFPFRTASGGFYLDKPPARIVMIIAGFRWFGESKLVARFPDALFGVATVTILFVFAAKRFGFLTGGLAASILLGAQGYLVRHGVRDAVMDSLTVLLALTILIAWIQVRDSGMRTKTWWLIGVAATAIACITKHLIGIAFVLPIVFIEVALWIVAGRKPKALVFALSLVFVAAIVSASYFLVTNHLTNGLFEKRLYSDIVLRATVGIDQTHLQGPFYYPVRLWQEFGLWLLLAIPAISVLLRRRASNADDCVGLLLLWVLMVVGGFSMSVSKLPWYVYPTYPAVSLVIAYGVREVVGWAPKSAQRKAIITLIALGAAADLRASWLAVRNDIHFIDAERFVRAYSSLDDARLYIDAPSISTNGRIRTWNRFYLEGAPNSLWLEETDVAIDQFASACVFVATGDVAKYRGTGSGRWRTIMRFRKIDRVEGDIWIVGTCDLTVPWALESEVVVRDRGNQVPEVDPISQ